MFISYRLKNLIKLLKDLKKFMNYNFMLDFM